MEIDDFISPDDILFLHSFLKTPLREYTPDEIERLIMFDLDLDIPMIEACLYPSYDSLNRMLRNGCTNIPSHLRRHSNIKLAAAGSGISFGITPKKTDTVTRYFRCLKYAHENGCPWNSDTYKAAVSSGIDHVINYLNANGCPKY